MATALLLFSLLGTDTPASRFVEIALERAAPLEKQGEREGLAALYEVTAQALLTLKAEGLTASQRIALTEALEQSGEARTARLRRAFDSILKKWEPRMEAPLPEGFPGPGPLDTVVTKEYPIYRAARTSGGRSAFWTLFGHITTNKIEMTAPVEMGMEEQDGALAMTDMAFLYESPEQGEAGTRGAVEVVNLEKVTVLSIGLRGVRSGERIAEARAQIETRLAVEGLAPAGRWRLLGYNSPMVPESERFFELQLPVRPRTP